MDPREITIIHNKHDNLEDEYVPEIVLRVSINAYEFMYPHNCVLKKYIIHELKACDLHRQDKGVRRCGQACF